MSHEVLMPQLGMSQDSAVLLNWHKSVGDPVSAGDVLFEVETDKAVMEVEARDAGYLVRVDAEAGSEVAVGSVIALIADSADAALDAAPAAAADAAPPAAEDGAAASGHEVLMPQLGMSQDSAVLLNWHKSVGDPVSAGDVLFEVETDKAVMEVEARDDGYLVRVDAEAGSEVAVGSVIALIADSADAAVAATATSPAAAATAPAATPAATPAPVAPPAAAATAATGAASRRAAGDKILASPKARRLAAERGVSLQQLLDAGMREPILARDLPDAAQLAGILSAAAESRAASDASPAASPVASLLSARYDAAAFAEFARWAGDYSEGAVDAAAIWASFALAAHERMRGEPADRRAAPWRVQVQTLYGADRLLALRGCTLGAAAVASADSAADESAEAAPDLQLHELSDSAIDELRCGTTSAPTLVITRRGDEGRLTLYYDQRQLPTSSALRWLDGIARRGAEPLQHLL